MCIIFFGVEIVLQCFAYAWYFRGFYFWVDLASTLSILTEIPAVMAEVAILVGGSGGESAEMLKAGKVLSGVLFRSSDLSATFVRFRGRSDRAVAAAPRRRRTAFPSLRGRQRVYVSRESLGSKPHASRTQAGRVGTKATKIIRIVRLVRMVRVVKLYRMTGDVDELRRDEFFR